MSEVGGIPRSSVLSTAGSFWRSANSPMTEFLYKYAFEFVKDSAMTIALSGSLVLQSMKISACIRAEMG